MKRRFFLPAFALLSILLIAAAPSPSVRPVSVTEGPAGSSEFFDCEVDSRRYIEQADSLKKNPASVSEEEMPASGFREDIPLPEAEQAMVRECCARYHVDENLAYALMWSESRFLPDVISETDDYGLMQINAYWHFDRMKEQYGITEKVDMLNPAVNIEYGISLLSVFLEQGSVDEAIAAYKGSAAQVKPVMEKYREYYHSAETTGAE